MYLSREEVSKFISLSEDVIYKMANQGEFPKPRRLSNRRVGWLVREVKEWAEGRPVSDILPPENTGHSNR
ncbi:helix-turn-helix transcriptional regulator [Curvibacter lanceolatus]|uniref:helix-turn-helix transcriptional regulator n=1 Tax=Curvibacter lanceolatus TaxID=86182 RepID=UPI00039D0D5C|nr:AlpA family phage regulatory protein [Curvibacter lanceolatus]